MSEGILLRNARRDDLPSIVRLLADDDLGSQREKYEEPLPQSYYAAFEQISADPNHQLIIAESDGKLIGTLHLMFLPSVSFQGGLRAQIESLRVDKNAETWGLAGG